MEVKVEGQPKKAYHAPVLHVYGGIQALTKSVGMNGFTPDGGSGNDKTT